MKHVITHFAQKEAISEISKKNHIKIHFGFAPKVPSETANQKVTRVT